MDNLFKNLSPATRKSRINFLKKLELSPSKYGKLEDVSKVMKTYVTNSPVPTTQATRMWHIIEFIKAMGEKELEAKWMEALAPIVQASKAKQQDTTTNVRADRYVIPLEGLRKILDTKAPVFVRGNSSTTPTLIRDLRDFVLISMYVNEPAVRNDLWELKVVTKAADLGSDGNYILVNTQKCYILLNRFKNSKHMGPQKRDIGPKTARAIRNLLLLYKDAGLKPTYLFNHMYDGQLHPIPEGTLKNKIKQVSQTYFDIPLSINDYRHIHEIALQSSDEYKTMSYDQKQAAHAKLMHMMDTGLKYNRV